MWFWLDIIISLDEGYDLRYYRTYERQQKRESRNIKLIILGIFCLYIFCYNEDQYQYLHLWDYWYSFLIFINDGAVAFFNMFGKQSFLLSNRILPLYADVFSNSRAFMADYYFFINVKNFFINLNLFFHNYLMWLSQVDEYFRVIYNSWSYMLLGLDIVWVKYTFLILFIYFFCCFWNMVVLVVKDGHLSIKQYEVRGGFLKTHKWYRFFFSVGSVNNYLFNYLYRSTRKTVRYKMRYDRLHFFQNRKMAIYAFDRGFFRGSSLDPSVDKVKLREDTNAFYQTLSNSSAALFNRGVLKKMPPDLRLRWATPWYWRRPFWSKYKKKKEFELTRLALATPKMRRRMMLSQRHLTRVEQTFIYSKISVFVFWFIWFCFFCECSLFSDGIYPELTLFAGDLVTDPSFFGIRSFVDYKFWNMLEPPILDWGHLSLDVDYQRSFRYGYNDLSVILRSYLGYFISIVDSLSTSIFFDFDFINTYVSPWSGFSHDWGRFFWWEGVRGDYKWILIGPSYVWPQVFRIYMDLDYFGMFSFNPWDSSWLALNKVFILLNNSGLLNAQFYSNDGLFYSYWVRWLALHAEWSSLLVNDLTNNNNVVIEPRLGLSTVTNKFVILNMLQQYDLVTGLLNNAPWTFTLLEKDLFFTKLLDRAVNTDPLENPEIKNNTNMSLDSGEYAGLSDQQRAAVLLKKEELKNDKFVYDFTYKGELLDTFRLPTPTILSQWKVWESYVQLKLRDLNKKKFGVDYYRERFVESRPGWYFSDSEWNEHVFFFSKNYRFFENMNYYFWVLTNRCLPEQIFFYTPKRWSWEALWWMFSRSWFNETHKNIVNTSLFFNTDYNKSFNFLQHIDSRFSESLYYKTFTRKHLYFPNSSLLLFQNSEESFNGFFIRGSSNAVASRFLLDGSFGWDSTPKLKINNFYKDLFIGGSSDYSSFVGNLGSVDSNSSYLFQGAYLGGVEAKSWDPSFYLSMSDLKNSKNVQGHEYAAAVYGDDWNIQLPNSISLNETINNNVVHYKDYFNNFNLNGLASKEVFLLQVLLDRYQSLFGRGLGMYYFIFPGWWKTRWFNYFLNYYVLEYKLLSSSGSLSGDNALLKKSNLIVNNFVDLEFNKFMLLLEDLDSPLFESFNFESDGDTSLYSNKFFSSIFLNKIFYFGFLNYPSNFYLYSMLDFVNGAYELKGQSPALNMKNLKLNLLASDLGIYLDYYGYLRQNVYNISSQSLPHTSLKNNSESYFWQKLVLSPWQSFVFRLYGFYKNQFGLSYYYTNVANDLDSLNKSLFSSKGGLFFWCPGTDSLSNYLYNFKNIQLVRDVTGVSDTGLGPGADALGSDINIYTTSTLDSFFFRAYDYKLLITEELVNVKARELYYWGNSWNSKNFGGFFNESREFLYFEDELFKAKYNKFSKLFMLYIKYSS